MSRFLDELNVTPMADGINWRHNAEFRFYSRALDRLILVPALEVTDFASTPRAIWSIIPPWGRHGAAACIHDRAYWDQSLTRDQADELLREAMSVLGVAPAVLEAIYDGVRLGGADAWARNAQLKANGLTRLASPGNTPPYAAAI